MQETSIALIALSIFAAVGGLRLADRRQAQAVPPLLDTLLGATAGYRRLALLSGLLLCLAQWLLGELLGWEIAIPAGLGLLGALGIANLYLAAVAPRAHLLATGGCGLLAVVGAVLLLATGGDVAPL